MVDHLPYTHSCFVCGADNPHGLKLRFTADDTGVRADFAPKQAHAGYPGLLHGGALGAALDEAMFWAATHSVGRMHMSVEMTVRYRSKVRVGEQYQIHARLEKTARSICRTRAEVLDAAGNVCATASGKYLPLPIEDEAAVMQDFRVDDGTVAPERFRYLATED